MADKEFVELELFNESFPRLHLKLLALFQGGNRVSAERIMADFNYTRSTMIVRITKLRQRLRKIDKTLNIVREHDAAGMYFRLVSIRPVKLLID